MNGTEKIKPELNDVRTEQLGTNFQFCPCLIATFYNFSWLNRMFLQFKRIKWDKVSQLHLDSFNSGNLTHFLTWTEKIKPEKNDIWMDWKKTKQKLNDMWMEQRGTNFQFCPCLIGAFSNFSWLNGMFPQFKRHHDSAICSQIFKNGKSFLSYQAWQLIAHLFFFTLLVQEDKNS